MSANVFIFTPTISAKTLEATEPDLVDFNTFVNGDYFEWKSVYDFENNGSDQPWISYRKIIFQDVRSQEITYKEMWSRLSGQYPDFQFEPNVTYVSFNRKTGKITSAKICRLDFECQPDPKQVGSQVRDFYFGAETISPNDTIVSDTFTWAGRDLEVLGYKENVLSIMHLFLKRPARISLKLSGVRVLYKMKRIDSESEMSLITLGNI